MSSVNPDWDHEADVVIAGYGGAGAVAAVSAFDAGASVLLLESMTSGGGNTRVSMGGFLCPSDEEKALTYFKALFEHSRSDMDLEIMELFAKESVKTVEFMTGLKEGAKVQVYGHAGFPDLPGADSMDKYLVSGKGKGQMVFAANLWDLLTHAVEEVREIPVMLETPVKRLITDDHGEVVGLIAEKGGKEISVRAAKAVILTTGGYEHDLKTLQNSVKGFPVYSTGNPGNKGDGLRLAQKVGAGLWHMNGVSCALGLKTNEFEAAFMIVVGAPGHIYVDSGGKRFVNERAIESHAGLLAVDFYDSHNLEYPRIPCYLIFDETARMSGPISRAAGLGHAGQQYEWSKDNSAEIAKGWITKGDTLQELAEKLGMQNDVLEKTVAGWNQDVASGEDTLFGRPIHAEVQDRPAYKDMAAPILSAALDNPPYYALKLHPSLINTQGGPRRNVKAQVLDAFGQPIPRLYSAGELGSMWGLLYQGAGNIAECIVFGRIAGKNAAEEC